jgi:transketolase C-terminal domain/subunit
MPYGLAIIGFTICVYNLAAFAYNIGFKQIKNKTKVKN